MAPRFLLFVTCLRPDICLWNFGGGGVGEGSKNGCAADHTMPQCVLWSWRGLVSLPSRPIGVLRRRRWLRVDAKVSRLRTWATPVRRGWPRVAPQLPVAREYLRPVVMVLSLMARGMFSSRPRSASWQRRDGSATGAGTR